MAKTKTKYTVDNDKGTVLILGKEYGVNDLPEETKKACLVHGLKQKLVDSICGMYGAEYTLAERQEEVDDLYGRLVKGQWKVTKTFKNPLERAESKLSEFTVDIEALRNELLASKMKPTIAESIIEKLYGDKVKALKAKIESLKK